MKDRMNPPPITVKVVDGRHECDPTTTEVAPGGTVAWTRASTASVSFPGRTPFVEGEGPFRPGSVSTVKSGEFFRNDREEFVPEVNEKPVNGVIIIDKGN